MLSYYTLLLEQSDIVSFKGLFNHVIMIGKFLLIIHIKTNNECFYQLYTSVAFSLACRELNSFCEGYTGNELHYGTETWLRME